MNIGNSIHRASGRTIRSDASYAIAGWPCANLAYHSNSSRENGGGDERKRAANAFLRVSYHRVTKRVCHTIRSREPRISIFFSRDHFPDSQQFSFSFQRNRHFDLLLFLDTKESKIKCYRCQINCSKKVESLRLEFTRGEIFEIGKKTFEDSSENFVLRNKKLSMDWRWKFRSDVFKKDRFGMGQEFLNFYRDERLAFA